MNENPFIVSVVLLALALAFGYVTYLRMQDALKALQRLHFFRIIAGIAITVVIAALTLIGIVSLVQIYQAVTAG